MTEHDILVAAIDALHANVALLDHAGSIIAVNERWRRFGRQRNAASDFLGTNYLDVCGRAARSGDVAAARVEAGLRRLLNGDAATFGQVYICAERICRMSARRLGDPFGGIIIAHEDITALLKAKRNCDELRQASVAMGQEHVTQVDRACEELGQRLAAISLAAQALERGGDPANAIALIHMAVDEARHELRALRYLNLPPEPN